MRSSEFNLERFSSGEHPTYIQINGEASERASLFAKLVQVNKSVKRLQHSGKYAAGNTRYTYATETDVVEPIAAALAKAGLATIPSVVEQWWHDLPGKYGINRVCTVHAQLMIADSETGAYIVAHTYSTAANGDKASNAAFTTAIKYLLAKLALVAFGDDADEFTAEGERADGSIRMSGSAAGKRLNKDERDDLELTIREAGHGDAVKKWVRKNKVVWSKITDKQVVALNEFLLSEEEAVDN